MFYVNTKPANCLPMSNKRSRIQQPSILGVDLPMSQKLGPVRCWVFCGVIVHVVIGLTSVSREGSVEVIKVVYSRELVRVNCENGLCTPEIVCNFLLSHLICESSISFQQYACTFLPSPTSIGSDCLSPLRVERLVGCLAVIDVGVSLGDAILEQTLLG